MEVSGVKLCKCKITFKHFIKWHLTIEGKERI